MATANLQATIGGNDRKKTEFDADFDIEDPLGPAEASTTTTTITTVTTSTVISCGGC